MPLNINIPSEANYSPLTPWYSKLLWATLAFLLFEMVTGFALFFLRPFLSSPDAFGQLHTIVSLVSLVAVWFYIVRHYKRVKYFASTLHYWLGVLTLTAFVIVAFSGAWIWTPQKSTVMDLVHVVGGFAFMVLLASHLTLVIRITRARLKK